MRILDQWDQEILEEDVDLEKGYLQSEQIIIETLPIEEGQEPQYITEDIQRYILYTQEELDRKYVLNKITALEALFVELRDGVNEKSAQMETSVTLIGNRFDSIRDTITSIDSNLGQIGAQVQTLNSSLVNNIEEVTTVKNNLDTVAENLAVAQLALAESVTDIQNLNSFVNNIIIDNGATNLEIQRLDSAISNTNNNLLNDQQVFTSLERDYNQTNNDISGLQDSQQVTEERVDNLSSDTEDLILLFAELLGTEE